MPDIKSSTTETLKIDCLFIDGDTRVMTLKDPRADLQSDDIAELNSYMQQKGIIIGDKYGASFLRINTATRVVKQKRTIEGLT